MRGLEKGTIKGFEGYEEGASEVDAMKEMEKAKVEIKEREERKALTKGATGPTEEPKMKFSVGILLVFSAPRDIRLNGRLYRRVNSAESQDQDTSYLHCLGTHTKTEKPWKKRLQKEDGIVKRQETNMVRDFPSQA